MCGFLNICCLCVGGCTVNTEYSQLKDCCGFIVLFIGDIIWLYLELYLILKQCKVNVGYLGYMLAYLTFTLNSDCNQHTYIQYSKICVNMFVYYDFSRISVKI